MNNMVFLTIMCSDRWYSKIMFFRVYFCLFNPNRQLYLSNEKERPACKTESFTEMGFQGKLRGLVPGFLGWAESSGQPRVTRLGEQQAGGQSAAQPWPGPLHQSCGTACHTRRSH